jgi:hypothetical protein
MMRAFSIFLVAAALSIPATAPAATLKPWVGFDGSMGKYSTGDINLELDAFNTGLIGTPQRLWPIGGGPGCGVSAGVNIGRSYSLGIGYDRVFASSSVDDPLAYLKVRLPANAFRGVVEYAFPRSGPLGAHVGVAAGKLMVTGQFAGNLMVTDQFAGRFVDNFAVDVRGSAPLYEVYLGGAWWGQPRCGLFATVGYRYARVKEVEVDGEVMYIADGTTYPDGSPKSRKFQLDYSGTLLRLGLKFPLGVPADAATPASTGRVKPWIGLNASFGDYDMTDVNDFPDLRLKKIRGGCGFGGSAGLDFPGHVTVGVGCDRLAASTEASNAGESVKFLMPANEFRGFVEYRLPSQGHIGLRLGIAGGAVMEAGSAATSFTTLTNPALRLKGSAALIEAYGSGEWQANSWVAATATLGYRHAKAGELAEDGELVFKKDGSPLTVDYSGMIARIGLKVALTK